MCIVSCCTRSAVEPSPTLCSAGDRGCPRPRRLYLRGFRDLDWAEAELLETHNLFLRAARVVDDRNLDVPKSLRNQIARKLEDAGVAPMRTAAIKEFAPVGRMDRATLYGEALPPGLVLWRWRYWSAMTVVRKAPSSDSQLQHSRSNLKPG